MKDIITAKKQLGKDTTAHLTKFPDGRVTIIVCINNEPEEIMILNEETYPEGSIRRMLDKYQSEEVSINQAIQEFNNYESKGL